MISSRKCRKEPWLTNGLCKSISKCKQMYKLSICKNSNEGVIEKYKNYRNCLNKLKRHVKLSYYQMLCLTLKNNTKSMGNNKCHNREKQ